MKKLLLFLFCLNNTLGASEKNNAEKSDVVTQVVVPAAAGFMLTGGGVVVYTLAVAACAGFFAFTLANKWRKAPEGYVTSKELVSFEQRINVGLLNHRESIGRSLTAVEGVMMQTQALLQSMKDERIQLDVLVKASMQAALADMKLHDSFGAVELNIRELRGQIAVLRLSELIERMIAFEGRLGESEAKMTSVGGFFAGLQGLLEASKSNMKLLSMQQGTLEKQQEELKSLQHQMSETAKELVHYTRSSASRGEA